MSCASASPLYLLTEAYYKPLKFSGRFWTSQKFNSPTEIHTSVLLNDEVANVERSFQLCPLCRGVSDLKWRIVVYSF